MLALQQSGTIWRINYYNDDDDDGISVWSIAKINNDQTNNNSQGIAGHEWQRHGCTNKAFCERWVQLTWRSIRRIQSANASSLLSQLLLSCVSKSSASSRSSFGSVGESGAEYSMMRRKVSGKRASRCFSSNSSCKSTLRRALYAWAFVGSRSCHMAIMSSRQRRHYDNIARC